MYRKRKLPAFRVLWDRKRGESTKKYVVVIKLKVLVLATERHHTAALVIAKTTALFCGTSFLYVAN